MAKIDDNNDDNDLVSERGIDYTHLRDLLKAGNWREADEETARLMLKVANQEEQGYLDAKSIYNFPCADISTIDQLWVKYSNGHFGFSVQKRIWLECGGKVDYETEKALGKVVGWCKKDNRWLSYNRITFTLDAPEGHLPILRIWEWWVELESLLRGWSLREKQKYIQESGEFCNYYKSGGGGIKKGRMCISLLSRPAL